MDEQERGVVRRLDPSDQRDSERGGDLRSKDAHNFARGITRAEFGRFYWNDDLEGERWHSFKVARERVRSARRELAKAKARKAEAK